MKKLRTLAPIMVMPLLLWGCVSAEFPFGSVQEMQEAVVTGWAQGCPKGPIQMVILDKMLESGSGSFYILWSGLQDPNAGRFHLLEYSKETREVIQMWVGDYRVTESDEIQIPEFPEAQKYDPQKHNDPCQMLNLGSLETKV